MEQTIQKRQRKYVATYKDRLAALRELNSSSLLSLNSTLQSRIEKYCLALQGSYTYTDTHTGKTVHARTYKKRLEFAEKEMESIQAILAVSYRHGKIGQDQVKEVSNYLRSLYQVAVRDNQYLQNRSTVLNTSRIGTKVNSLERSLEESRENSTKMKAYTAYGLPPKFPYLQLEAPKEITSRAPLEPAQAHRDGQAYLKLFAQGLSFLTDPEQSEIIISKRNGYDVITAAVDKNGLPARSCPLYDEVVKLNMRNDPLGRTDSNRPVNVSPSIRPQSRVLKWTKAGIAALCLTFTTPSQSNSTKHATPYGIPSAGNHSQIYQSERLGFSNESVVRRNTAEE